MPNKKARTAARTKLRAAKQAFTRRKAERLISGATQLSQLDDPRLDHKNKHVQDKLQKKRARLLLQPVGDSR
jgi:hypothetical protein